MGSTCKKPEKESAPSSTIKISNLQAFQGMQLNFTIDKLTRIQTQCLILFTDKKLKVNRNQFLQKCGNSIATKVQQYLDVYLIKNKLLPGQCVILDTIIAQFSFQKICIVCLQVWGGKQKSKISQPLIDCLQKCIRKVKQQKISWFCVVEFNSQFGLPNQKADHALLKSIYDQRNGLKIVTFILNNYENMIEMKKKVTQFNQKIISQKKSEVSRDSSTYY